MVVPKIEYALFVPKLGINTVRWLGASLVESVLPLPPAAEDDQTVRVYRPRRLASPEDADLEPLARQTYGFDTPPDEADIVGRAREIRLCHQLDEFGISLTRFRSFVRSVQRAQTIPRIRE